MKFTKMHGAGNDFIVIENNNKNIDWRKLAITMCNRNFGVGADGILLLGHSKTADFNMRIFNADGSESTTCGNGLRCLVKYYIDNNNDRHDSEITVETSAGIRRARIHHRKGKVSEIQASMGEPRVGHNGTPAKAVYNKEILDIKSAMDRIIKINGNDLLLHLISIGNPHAVHFTNDSVFDFPLTQLGPKVEQHKLFPDETNFEVVRIIDNKNVEARVWERGVGETLACGSGACAVAVAGVLLGLIDNKVNVNLPGGTLKVEWNITSEVFLSGPAVTTFIGEW
jgi:diaminopimelate epimerase